MYKNYTHLQWIPITMICLFSMMNFLDDDDNFFLSTYCTATFTQNVCTQMQPTWRYDDVQIEILQRRRKHTQKRKIHIKYTFSSSPFVYSIFFTTIFLFFSSVPVFFLLQKNKMSQKMEKMHHRRRRHLLCIYITWVQSSCKFMKCVVFVHTLRVGTHIAHVRLRSGSVRLLWNCMMWRLGFYNVQIKMLENIPLCNKVAESISRKICVCVCICAEKS